MPYRGHKHNPDETAILMDIEGHCDKCHKRGTARLVAYYSGEVIIRCNACKKVGGFVPDDNTYNDPRKFAPFIFDNDEDGYEDTTRHTRGRR